MKFLVLLSTLLAVACADLVVPYLHGNRGTDDVHFKYYADVRVGVLDPEVFASQSILRADLFLRNDAAGNGSIVFLKNAEIAAYSGRLDIDERPKNQKWVSLPQKNSDLLLPFYVSYNERGLIEAFFFDPEDADWSLNLKKGLAGLIQFDWKKISEAKYRDQRPVSFQCEERTIFGESEVTYSVKRNESNFYLIDKFLDPKRSEGYYRRNISNSLSSILRRGRGLGLGRPEMFDYRTDSRKRYFVETVGSSPVLRRIESSYRLTHYPLGGQENVQYVHQNQSIVFVDYVKPTEFIDIQTSKFAKYESTKISPLLENDEYLLPDISYGHRIHNFDTLQKRVKKMILDAVEYIKEPQVNHLRRPDLLQSHLIAMIMDTFRSFKNEHFYNIYKDLENNPQAIQIVLGILHSVGTQESILFIKEIINGDKGIRVSPKAAGFLLYRLGHGTYFPDRIEDSIEALKTYEALYQFPENERSVQNAGILAFSNIIFKFYKQFGDHTIIEKYIKVYYGKFKDATTYESRFIWLRGLLNIQGGSVYTLLRPLLLQEKDENLRASIIWGFFELLSEAKRDDTLSKDLMKIISNPTDYNLENRIAALEVILHRASGAREFQKLLQHFQVSSDPQLYSYFYTHIKQLSRNKIGFQTTNSTIYAREIEKSLTNLPNVYNSGVFYYDFIDQKCGTGFQVYEQRISDEQTDVVFAYYYRITSYVDHRVRNSFDVYLKFRGIENPISRVLKNFNVFNLTSFKESSLFIRKPDSSEPVLIEIAAAYHDKFFFVRQFNEETIKSFYTKDLMDVLSQFDLGEFTDIWFSDDSQLMMPTDAGIPVMIFSNTPVFLNTSLKLIPATNSLTVRASLRIWSYGSNGIWSYSPFAFADSMASRSHGLDVNLPIQFKATWNRADGSVKITFEHPIEPIRSGRGIKTFVESAIMTAFPNPEVQLLEPKYQTLIKVTRGEHFQREKREIANLPLRGSGLDFSLGIYDYELTQSEYDLPFAEIPRFKPDFFRYLKGYQSYEKFLGHFVQWLYNSVFIKPVGSFGTYLLLEPSRNHPVKEVEFKAELRHKQVYSDNSTIKYGVFPSIYNKLRFNLTSFKEPGVLSTQWNGKARWNHRNGQFFNSLELHLWREISNASKLLNVYFKREKEWLSDKIEGRYEFLYGSSDIPERPIDGFQISVDYEGEKSREQLEGTQHGNCRSRGPIDSKGSIGVHCLLVTSSVRHYKYQISYSNVPGPSKRFFRYIWQVLNNNRPPKYTTYPFRPVGEGNFAVDVIYPTSFIYYPSVDIAVSWPEEGFVFEKFPISDNHLLWADFLNVPSAIIRGYRDGLVKACTITKKKFYPPRVHSYYPSIELANDWTLYASNAPEKYDWAFYLKQLSGGYLATKFVLESEFLIIEPEWNEKTGHFQYIFSGSTELLDSFGCSGANLDAWNRVKIWSVDETIVISLPNVGIYFVYDKDMARFKYLAKERQYYGGCFAM